MKKQDLIGLMTKQDLIQFWKEKQIAIQNDDKEALIDCLYLLGAKVVPEGDADFYFFCDNTKGWDTWPDQELPTIRATKAVQILSEPGPKAMTRQELISKWYNKEIAIQNDDEKILIQTLALIGVEVLPLVETFFYFFCDDEYGWGADDETNLPTIKATKALAILTEPGSTPEATTKIIPPKLSPTAAAAAFKSQPNQTPWHYRALPIQPWDMLVKIYGAKAVALHLRMSAFEYRMRAGYKDESASDLAKAMHCEAKAKELESGEA